MYHQPPVSHACRYYFSTLILLGLACLLPGLAMAQLGLTTTAMPNEINEPGAPVEFTLTITNQFAQSLTIDSISTAIADDVIDVNGRGTCNLSVTDFSLIPANSSSSCKFSIQVNANAGTLTPTTTVVGTLTGGTGGGNDQASDDVIIDVFGVAPSFTLSQSQTTLNLPEPGGTATFTLNITNTSVSTDPITVRVPEIRIDGSLVSPVSTTCARNDLNPGGSYQCQYQVAISGIPGDTPEISARVSVFDDELTSAVNTVSSTATITDVQPSISVFQDPGLNSLPEGRNTTNFLVTIFNDSVASDPVSIQVPTITVPPNSSVSNNTCAATTIPADDFYTCSYDVTAAGDVGGTVPVQIQVNGLDNEGNTASAENTVNLTFEDVLPSLEVSVTPATTTVEQPGGSANFTLTVRNTSVLTDQVTIGLPVITPTVSGGGSASVDASACQSTMLDGDGTDEYSCSFQVLVSNALVGDSVDISAVVSGTDDEGNPVSASDTALIAVTGTDYGDAPSSYPTAGANAASHTIDLNFLLGSQIDSEADGQPSVGADGDDLNALDDEDGVTLLADSLIPGLSVELEVVGPEGGILDAWVDFNIDGDWSDPNEHAIDGAVLGASPTTLQFLVPSTAVAGTSYIRFRLSRQGTGVPGGFGGPGEVEDYTVDIESVGLAVDKTATPAGVPEPGGDVTFGVSVQNTGSVTVTLTTLDDSLYGNLDGQGDCELPQTLDPQDVYSCSFTEAVSGRPDVVIRNTVEATAEIQGLQIVERDTVEVTILNLLPSLAVEQLPATTSVDEPGDTVAFELQVTNTSGSSDQVIVNPPTFDTSGTVSANSCTEQVTVLPNRTYSCNYSITLNGNAGDVLPVTVNVTARDDEDTQTSGSDTSQVTLLDVAPSATLTQTPAETLVDQIAQLVQFDVSLTNTSVGSDPITLDAFTPQPSGVANATLESTNCDLGSEIQPGESLDCRYTLRVSGEVGESLDADLNVTFSDDEANADSVSASSLVTVTGTDYGDAPDSYRTLEANGGASHTISPGFHLGTLVDAEADGLPSPDAQGDDLDNLDDEDGIVFQDPLRAANTVTLQISVTGGPGFLNAWVDFNRDGDWTDTDEQILENEGLGSGVNFVDIELPDQLTPGPSFARFRLTRLGDTDLLGPAPDGEVEDYPVTLEASYDLALRKSAQPNPLGLNVPVTYTFTVGNLVGPQDASGGVITDPLPTGMAFLDSEDGCTEDLGTVTCPVNPIAAGEFTRIRFRATVTEPSLTVITNTATLVSNETDADASNNQATETVTLDVVAPTVTGVSSVPDTADGVLAFCESARVAVTGLELSFSKTMSTFGDGSATLVSNYRLIGAGPDDDIETFTCGEVLGDDETITISGANYSATTDTATLTLNGGQAIPEQAYLLLVCPSLTDEAGNPIDGDEDGVGGEEYLFQFRTDPENLFANGNLDCDLDGWNRGSPDPNVLSWVEDDVDNAMISGAALITAATQNPILSQCAPITGGEIYTVAGQTRVTATQSVTVRQICDFFDGANCVGFLERQSGGDTLPGTDFDWTLTETTFLTPANAVSARCGYSAQTSATDFEVLLDDLLLRQGGPTDPLIFRDGFE